MYQYELLGWTGLVLILVGLAFISDVSNVKQNEKAHCQCEKTK
jgi:hypothetical protein